MSQTFDRRAGDVGNIVLLEHINLTVPDLEVATAFYVTALGLTRDPYMDFGTFNTWVNAGETQFHLPRGDAQRWRGRIGLVVNDLSDIEAGLRFAKPALEGSKFDIDKTSDKHWQITCPWGNQLDVRTPGATGPSLGIHYATYPIPEGGAAGVARFYEQVIGSPVTVSEGRASVQMGRYQQLIFEETAGDIADYDGHHIAVYLSNFSGPHEQLLEAGRITEESDAHQYRFVEIFDPDSGETIIELEHEVRSLHHPMFNRPLINRNAGNGFFNFRAGREAFVPD
ncbi:MAG: VOC family protein [Pseudomonadaceae bacterium]|nr:VOC family protein [Pseudomonadaceae bacterium]